MFDARDSNISFARISWILALFIFSILLMPFSRSYFFNTMGRWLYILIFSFSVSYLLTPVTRKIAIKLDIVDNPEERKIHKRSTPLLGGLAVIIAFIVHKQANWQNVLWCVGISLVLWVVVDILAAAAGGRPAPPAVEAEAPVPVDA